MNCVENSYHSHKVVKIQLCYHLLARFIICLYHQACKFNKRVSKANIHELQCSFMWYLGPVPVIFIKTQILTVPVKSSHKSYSLQMQTYHIFFIPYGKSILIPRGKQLLKCSFPCAHPISTHISVTSLVGSFLVLQSSSLNLFSKLFENYCLVSRNF